MYTSLVVFFSALLNCFYHTTEKYGYIYTLLSDTKICPDDLFKCVCMCDEGSLLSTQSLMIKSKCIATLHCIVGIL